MKYNSPKINNTTESYSCPSPELEYVHIPKGLSKEACKIMIGIRRNRYYELSIENMTKEELFNLSKEISDFNIGLVYFPASSNGSITIGPIEETDNYALDARLFKYTLNYQISELCDDICTMSKENYRLEKFSYIPEGMCYVACFTKYSIL